MYPTFKMKLERYPEQTYTFQQILQEPKILFQKIEDEATCKRTGETPSHVFENPIRRTGKQTRELCSLEAAGGDRRISQIRSAGRGILSAKAVPKSKKLLKLEVDLGIEKRTIVSGISQSYKPEEADRQKSGGRGQFKARDSYGNPEPGDAISRECGIFRERTTDYRKTASWQRGVLISEVLAKIFTTETTEREVKKQAALIGQELDSNTLNEVMLQRKLVNSDQTIAATLRYPTAGKMKGPRTNSAGEV